MFNKVLRKRQIKRNEIRKIIACIAKYGLDVVKCGIGGDFRSLKEAELLSEDGLDLTRCFYIVQKLTSIEFTTKFYENKACTYIFTLDEKTVEQKSGLQCFMEMSKFYKIPKIIDQDFYKDQLDETGRFTLSTSPVIDYNKENDGKEFINCYEYDLNSAYSSIILAGIPDLWHPSEINIGKIKVKKGEIGFIFDEQLPIVEPGGIADIKFKMIPCPEELKNFVLKYYNIKKTSTGREKQKAKEMLNLPIGYCQRYNPFFRSYIIHRCNERIEKIIDENTLFWNTDAIFSTKRRYDLEIGENIGQFKELKLKRVRYKGNNYQVNDEIPTYRGIPKLWFKKWEEENGRCYNILTDEIPSRRNKYKFDMNTLKLEVYR